MSKALLLDGQIEQAFEQCERALTLARKRGEKGHEAYALHVLGEITAHPDFLNKQLAESYFNDALNIAEEFDMRPLQVRCLQGLSLYHHNLEDLEKAENYNNNAAAILEKLNI